MKCQLLSSLSCKLSFAAKASDSTFYKAKKLHHRLHINKEAQADILWWKSFSLPGMEDCSSTVITSQLCKLGKGKGPKPRLNDLLHKPAASMQCDSQTYPWQNKPVGWCYFQKTLSCPTLSGETATQDKLQIDTLVNELMHARVSNL